MIFRQTYLPSRCWNAADRCPAKKQWGLSEYLPMHLKTLHENTNLSSSSKPPLNPETPTQNKQTNTLQALSLRPTRGTPDRAATLASLPGNRAEQLLMNREGDGSRARGGRGGGGGGWTRQGREGRAGQLRMLASFLRPPPHAQDFSMGLLAGFRDEVAEGSRICWPPSLSLVWSGLVWVREVGFEF